MANTKNNLIAKRYSDALIELVKEYNMDLGKTENELKSIAEVLKESAELSDVMSNPIISINDKKDIISKLFKDKIDIVVINFINLLIDKERFNAFEEISECFSKAVADINNVKEVKVISAIELKEELKDRLIEKLSSKLNKKIELACDVDKDIIAGLVIKIDDNIIDMSLKHKFEELNKEMTK